MKKRVQPELTEARVKFSFKKHLWPPLVGLFVMVVMLGVLNSQFVAAKIYAFNYDTAQNSTELSLATSQKTVDKSDASLIIENIGVKAPVIYGQENSESAFQLALRDGVVHYPGTALPGQPGNVAIFGHSSGQVWAPGDYKFVFAPLEKLQAKDRIFIHYKGVRYIYKVREMKVVKPSDVSVLQPTKDNVLTVITCTPVGTNTSRLIVIAEQIVPRPTSYDPTAKTNTAPLSEIKELPNSQSPSIWESLRSIF